MCYTVIPVLTAGKRFFLQKRHDGIKRAQRKDPYETVESIQTQEFANSEWLLKPGRYKNREIG